MRSLRTITYGWARRHPWVLLDQGDLEEMLARSDRQCHRLVAMLDTAHLDAEMIYHHMNDVLDIVGLYQASLKTLCAPDPHEPRVQMVATNFLAQYKERYG